MAEKQEKIIFTTEDNEKIAFFVLEETRVNGINYILVADSDDEEEEANALILKEMDGDGDEAVYDLVEDDQELTWVSKIFEELMDDIDIEME